MRQPEPISSRTETPDVQSVTWYTFREAEAQIVYEYHGIRLLDTAKFHDGGGVEWMRRGAVRAATEMCESLQVTRWSPLVIKVIERQNEYEARELGLSSLKRYGDYRNHHQVGEDKVVWSSDQDLEPDLYEAARQQVIEAAIDLEPKLRALYPQFDVSLLGPGYKLMQACAALDTEAQHAAADGRLH